MVALLSMTSVSAPPSINSITTHNSNVSSCKKASRKLTMLSCRLSFITMISFTISSLRGCDRRSICLIATCARGPYIFVRSCAIFDGAVSRIRATYTDPDAPWPIFFCLL